MGNRAVITTKENFENNGIGIYLHWNGGYDSVSAFLKYCELKGYRSLDSNNCGFARLCQVIGNFFGGSCSVEVDVVNNLDCDNWDNGVYIVEGWKIVDRKYFNGKEQMKYDLNEMLMEIDSAMPKNEQIGEYLKAEEIPTKDLKAGDTVFIMDNLYGKPVKCHVMGFCKDEFRNVNGLPYVDKYGEYFSHDKNINNYIQTKTVRVIKEAVNMDK